MMGVTGYIWAGAICIDHSDVEEHFSQAMPMVEIYSRIKRVVLWPGPKTMSPDLAMDFFSDILARIPATDLAAEAHA